MLPPTKTNSIYVIGGTVTHAEQLHNWIAANLPELAGDLLHMGGADARARLNALTGCTVRCCDTIEDAAAMHLAALQDLTGQQ